jgi:hypothetical protein
VKHAVSRLQKQQHRTCEHTSSADRPSLSLCHDNGNCSIGKPGNCTCCKCDCAAALACCSDLQPFFANKKNAKAVYSQSKDAAFVYHHAILLVGYKTDSHYWIAKNSWGSGWADGGFFKVGTVADNAFDTKALWTDHRSLLQKPHPCCALLLGNLQVASYSSCSDRIRMHLAVAVQVAFGAGKILSADNQGGQAYGVAFTPYKWPVALKLPVTASQKANCYTYKVSASSTASHSGCAYVRKNMSDWRVHVTL